MGSGLVCLVIGFGVWVMFAPMCDHIGFPEATLTVQGVIYYDIMFFDVAIVDGSILRQRSWARLCTPAARRLCS